MNNLNLNFQCRWGKVHDTSLDWVSRMSILVECWNKLEGNVDRLNSWVTQVKNKTHPSILHIFF